MQEYTNCHRTGGKKKRTVPPVTPVTDPTLSSPETDPQGMYTGVPADPKEKPVQDADDL